jgi:hypothetical protein
MIKELPEEVWVSVISGYLGTNELLKMRELNLGGKNMFEKMVAGRKRFMVMKIRMPFVRRDVHISKTLQHFIESSNQCHQFIDYIKEYKVTFVSGMKDNEYDFYQCDLTFKERQRLYRDFEEITNQWKLELFPKVIQRFKKLLSKIPRYLWECCTGFIEPDISIEVEGYIPMHHETFQSVVHHIVYSYKNRNPPQDNEE